MIPDTATDLPTIPQLLQAIGAPQSELEHVLLVRVRQIAEDYALLVAIAFEPGRPPVDRLAAHHACRRLWARADELADAIWVCRHCLRGGV